MSMITLERCDSLGILTMNGEGKFNPESLQDFNDALDELLADEQSQALIITGENKSFAQGLDLDYLTAAAPDEAMRFVESCMVMVGRLLRFPIPTVAAVNGHAFGLGAMIMLACDYRVMREDRGYFCLPEVDLHMVLIPTMNALVCNKLSGALLRDTLLCGARIGGEEAMSRGLVDQCCTLAELMDNAITLAQPMMAKDRHTLSGLKAGINQATLTVIDQLG